MLEWLPFWFIGLYLLISQLSLDFQMLFLDEWGDYLPRFREDDAQHLIKFDECMDQLDIHHQGVFLKNVYVLPGRRFQTMVQISSRL